jgi:preprotein translocase subunit SecG
MTAFLIAYVVPVIHVLACLFLIVVVLLQTGKGADMGAVFGGGSQTLFGSGGAGNFLTKLTTGTAIAFMLTSLVLTYGASRSPTSELIQKLPASEAPAEVPAAPFEGDAPTAEPQAGAEPPAATAEAPAPVDGAEAPAAEPAAPAADAPAPAPAEPAPTP